MSINDSSRTSPSSPFASTSAPPSGSGYGSAAERTLVLGGGGSAGNAWLIGVLAGLSEAGIDVTDADRIIGTSAGSTTAAQVTGSTPARLLADVLSAPPRPQSVPGGAAGPAAPSIANRVAEQMRRTGEIIAASADLADMRRRMGAAAVELAAASGGSPAHWRGIVAARLPQAHWPERNLLITAVDAQTGEPVVFDRHSGVDLADAVAASTSSGPAYRIGDRWYIDGGYRSNADNADLAAGSARVLVLSPFGGATRTPAAWGTHLADQIAALEADGSRVSTFFPDDTARAAFGDNAMDPASRPPAARAGFAQGRSRAEVLIAFWR